MISRKMIYKLSLIFIAALVINTAGCAKSAKNGSSSASGALNLSSTNSSISSILADSAISGSSLPASAAGTVSQTGKNVSKASNTAAVSKAASTAAYKDPVPTSAPQYTGPAWDTQSDTWAGTDELGRSMPTYAQVGAKKSNKIVGMLYFTWHPNVFALSATGDSKNITDILSGDLNALTDPNDKNWSGPGSFYWGKPLFGYYNLNFDDYVIKKHAQMLSDIGVDTVIFEFTNYLGPNTNSDFMYTMNTVKHILDCWEKVRGAGGKTPQFFFMTTWGGAPSANCASRIYNDIYKTGLYKDMWFRWQGKPFILADKNAVTDNTLKNYFTYRLPYPDYGQVNQPNAWSWLSIYPQKAAYTSGDSKEEVAVGPAQNYVNGPTHPGGPTYSFMSAMDSLGNFIARGRSYHNGQEPLLQNPASSSYPSKMGYNFQEGLNQALSINPDFLWLEGWNEWIAGRFLTDSLGVGCKMPEGGGFGDDYTAEFSRDLEPTLTGGLGDNYYMQAAENIRKFKGVSPPPQSSPAKTINIDGNFSDWTGVMPEYRDDIADQAYRNTDGIYDDTYYVNKTGRNDFKLMKVTHDSSNVYFYVQTQSNITNYRGGNWMRLFIQTNPSASNWEGYNYVLNRTGITDTATTLEKSTGGWKWTAVDSNIQYKISGNNMELAIPLKDLGLNPNTFSIQFKWNDNMQNQGDVYDFYLNGDTAPNGRFNYVYSAQ